MDDATTLVRFALGAVMLLGAVAFDLRARRVPNPWWVPFLWMAAVLLVGDLVRGEDRTLLAIRVGMSVLLAGVFYALWRAHLFGGADAKGLMVLSLLAPWPPDVPGALQPALDALANGAALMLALPLVFLAANLARGDAAFPAAFLGLRMDLERARRRHVWPMQRADADGTLRWRYWQHVARSLDADYAALERAGLARVWVTPKVPFMLPILLGWACAWRWGDLVLLATRAVLGG